MLLRHPFWIYFLFVFTTSCTPQTRVVSVPAEPVSVETFDRVDHEMSLPWGREEAVLVIVNKTCQTLNIYNYGQLIRTFPVVLGREPGRKLYQGDRRTPNGLYSIIDNDPHPRWARFMLLDYPSAEDYRRYQLGLSSRLVPGHKRGGPGPGGAIGIHGSDREAFNRAKINWTLGCVSLLNSDMKEFENMVPVGTFVYIHE